MLPQTPKTPVDTRQSNDSGVNGTQKRLKNTVKGQLIMTGCALLLVIVLIFAMSVAWFTNVAQTGGLQFQTEAWGFDIENIKISQTGAMYQLSPGSVGFVPLTIDNSSSSSAVNAVVNIDKTGIRPEMQQRIFFYVDAAETYSFGTNDEVSAEAEGISALAENEGTYTETVTRIYLGSEEAESYKYSVPAGEILTLTEAYYSDAPLKWEWVYDMTGYYFRGTVEEAGVVVSEYLRPIRYDLNDAVFDLEPTENYGQLVRVGDKPLSAFLKEIFDTDGYEGTLALTDGEIDPQAYVKIGNRVYYKVSVDEDGQGIWAYLCNYTDTKAAGEYDNALSETEAEQMIVTVKVTVSNVESKTTTVSTVEDLRDMMQSNEDQVIRLSQDVTASEPFVVPENVSATVDLNGHTIVYSGGETAYSLFTVPQGAELTLVNGELHGNGDDNSGTSATETTAISCMGGKATISGLKVTGFDTAVFADDRNTGTDSVIKISDCDFDTNSTAVFVYGNGSETSNQSRIIIQKSKIKSNYIGISGQGTNKADDQRWGTELVVANSEIEGRWAGIYQPQQQSSTTIYGCTIRGYTGIAVKGGTVNIYASEITGTGEHAEAGASSSGWTDTGDGVYVEASYGWGATVVLRGMGNRVESKNGYALELFGVSGKGPGKLLVEGGTHVSELGKIKWNEIGTFTILDGTVVSDSPQGEESANG